MQVNALKERYQSLDGWRGISILLVLAGHLLPLGLKHWRINYAIPSAGMALFFILSGFLITQALLRHPNYKHFILRRLARIVPLSWLVLLIMLILHQADFSQWFANLLFYANLSPSQLIEGNGHFWSLCLEVQFYLFIAFLVAFFKEKAFWLLPILCLSVTALRIHDGVGMSLNTFYRADEILAGCCLALIYSGKHDWLKERISQLSTLALFVLLVISAHPNGGWLNYYRPYFAMLLVGSTLFSPTQGRLIKTLQHPALVYVATISYGLYIIHGALMSTWLGSGDRLTKYAKRPLLILLTWWLAHLSTFYFEKHWINVSKKLTSEKPHDVSRIQILKHYARLAYARILSMFPRII